MHLDTRDTFDVVPPGEVQLWVSDGVVGTKISVFLACLLLYDAGTHTSCVCHYVRGSHIGIEAITFDKEVRVRHYRVSLLFENPMSDQVFLGQSFAIPVGEHIQELQS